MIEDFTSLKQATLASIVLLCSCVIVTYVYFIDSWSVWVEPVFFWIPLVVATVLVFYAAITIDSRLPVLLTLIFAIALHLIPIVRMPLGIAWNTNAPYDLQLLEHVLKTGRWDFGYGTQTAASEFSYYPPMYLLLAISAIGTNIPAITVEKYMIALLNPLLILTLYVFAKRVTSSNKLSNIVVAFYLTNPLFYGLGSYTVCESYAIILFPLLLSYFVGATRGHAMSVVFIILLATVAWAHHFTSYMLALSVMAAFALGTISRNNRIAARMVALTLVLPAAWLSFLAVAVLSTHASMVEIIFANIRVEFRLTGYYSLASSMWYPNEIAQLLALVRDAALVFLTGIGLLVMISSWSDVPKPRWKNALAFYAHRLHRLTRTPSLSFLTALLFSFSAFAFAIMFMIAWGISSRGGLGFGDIRLRATEFLFIPLSVFSSLAIVSLSARHRVRIATVVLLAALVLMPAGIVNGFPRILYNQGYQPQLFTEFEVEPQEKVSFGMWVLQTIPPTTDHSFTGSYLESFVEGYGYQPYWENNLFNITAAKQFACQLRTTVVCSSGQPCEVTYTKYGVGLFYVVDRSNVALPDDYGRRLDNSTLWTLEREYDRAYDSGSLMVYWLPSCTG